MFLKAERTLKSQSRTCNQDLRTSLIFMRLQKMMKNLRNTKNAFNLIKWTICPTLKGVADMIYTIEKRHAFGYGTMSTHYEVIGYQGRYKNGVLFGSDTIKVTKTKREAKEYCKQHKIVVSDN